MTLLQIQPPSVPINTQLLQRSTNTLETIIDSTFPFDIVDASLDQNGKAETASAFFTNEGALQLMQFQPVMAHTAFRVEARTLHLALRDW
jgi:hypothetical protein